MSQCPKHLTSGIACEDRGCAVQAPTSISLAAAIQAVVPVVVAEPRPEAKPSAPIKWFDRLFEHPGLNLYDVLVGAYLWRRAGKTMECWPRQNEIAKACHIERKTANRAVGRLTKWGLIEMKHRRSQQPDGKITAMSNKYRLIPPEQWITVESQGLLGIAVHGTVESLAHSRVPVETHRGVADGVAKSPTGTHEGLP
jgi:hypothetical protein